MAPSYRPCVVCNFYIVCTMLLRQSWKEKRIHYSVNLPNKGNKRKLDTYFFLSFFPFSFFLFFRHLIKSLSLHKNCTHYKEFITVFVSFTWEWKNGVAPWHKIFTSSCVIPLWDSATAHSPSGKEFHSSSFNQSYFPGLIVVWYSHVILTYPNWALFVLMLTPITH